MRRALVLSALLLSLAGGAIAAPGRAPHATQHAQPDAAATLNPSEIGQIDRAAADVLARTGVPSVSIAVVRDGRIAYVRAYGAGRLDPTVPANPAMRYGIGSITKQFTATAILMLADEGRLSLDDPVGKYVPGLTDGDRITIRQVLSHTSGYRDFWPQDYVMQEMLVPATPQHILDKWARIPLDFQPGDQWQYSNTGYVVAGLIVQKVSGQPWMNFVRQRIADPLGMSQAVEVDTHGLGPDDAKGYTRYALGPLRPAPKEAAGWLFAMGELAMPARDLALWDIGFIDHKLISAAAWQARITPIKLNNGKDSGYGLGVDVAHVGGRLRISHGGEISGFRSENRVYPDQRTAVVVLTNDDVSSASGALADRIESVLFPASDAAAQGAGRARAVFDGLRQGHIDRSQFTANGNAYFSDTALQDFAASLGPLGEPTSFTQVSDRLRGGFTAEVYRVTYPGRTLVIVLRAEPNGRIEQFEIGPSDQ